MSDPPRPKMVTVKFDQNKPKPTTKKTKPIQAEVDVGKEFNRCVSYKYDESADYMVGVMSGAL